MPAPQSGFNMNDLTSKLQQFQKQIENLHKMQANVSTTPDATSTGNVAPVASSYPRVVRTDTVEDILANPQWKAELETEFADSQMGIQAKNYREVMFMEFCEKQTGKPSTMLEGLRKETAKATPQQPMPRSGKAKSAPSSEVVESNKEG